MVVTIVALAIVIGVGLLVWHVGTPRARHSVDSVTTSIPVAETACPSLRLVHVAAERAGRHWAAALNKEISWKEFAAQLGPKLPPLAAALRAAIPLVPARVSRDLRFALKEVQIGRIKLKTARSIEEYTFQHRNVLAGYVALAHASNLIGNQCGFVLAPAPLTS